VLAARLRGAAVVLLIYDLYPERSKPPD